MDRKIEIEKLIRQNDHTGYPNYSDNWNAQLLNYYSAVYDFNCDYNKLPEYDEVIKLFEMGIRQYVCPLWGKMNNKSVLLLFDSTEDEVKMADVELLIRKLSKKLGDKYPEFQIQLAVVQNNKVLYGPI